MHNGMVISSIVIQSAIHLYSAFIQSAVHLYSAFIQSAVQFMPLIHPFTHTHTHTHQWWLAAMQGTIQLVRSNWGVRCLAQGHFGTPRVGSNLQPSDCQTTALTSWVISPPEPNRLNETETNTETHTKKKHKKKFSSYTSAGKGHVFVCVILLNLKMREAMLHIAP